MDGITRRWGPILFFSNQDPDLSKLCMITLTVNSDEGKGVSSKIQPQIIKCRQLIFTEPDIIASPELSEDRKLIVIMQQSLYKSGKLQGKFQKMSLEPSKPVPVNAACYKTCLTYTLLAKLAPNWNKVGSLLIQGRDFLTFKHKLAAVRMEINMNASELYISLDVKVVRSPPLEIEDLEICRPIIEEFYYNPNGVIQEHSIDRQWCHVLPSMKKGRVVKVVRKLPEDCPYKSYKDLKRFWKNSYGYRLPEEEPAYFFQVYFLPLPNTLFTYPSCCVRQRDVIHFPRQNPQPIIEAFLKDVHTKMSTVCGVKMNFRPKGQFLTTELNEISEEHQTPLQWNLTSRVPAGLQHTVNRQLQTPVVQPQQNHVPTFSSQNNRRDNVPISASQNSSQYGRPVSMLPNTSSQHAGSQYNNNVLSQRLPPYQAKTGNRQLQSAILPPTQNNRHQFSSQQSRSSTSVNSSQSRAGIQQQCFQGQKTSVTEQNSFLRPGGHYAPVVNGPNRGNQQSSQNRCSNNESAQDRLVESNKEADTCRQNLQGLELGISTGQRAQIDRDLQKIMDQKQSSEIVVQSRPLQQNEKIQDETSCNQFVDNQKQMKNEHRNEEPTRPIDDCQAHSHQLSKIENNSGETQSGSKRIIPQFKPVKPATTNSQNSTAKSSSNSNTGKLVPSFKPVKKSTGTGNHHVAGKENKLSSNNAKSSLTPFRKPPAVILEENKNSLTSPAATSKGKIPGMEFGLQGSLQSRDSTPQQKSSITPSFNKTPKSAAKLDLSSLISHKDGGKVPGSQFGLQGSSVMRPTTPSSIKRMADSTSIDGTKAKKPRAKPTVDTSVDVKSMAVNHQLNKVNTATLMAWMKGQGIQCKSKDKKGDLIMKVNTFLNITVAEQ